MAKVTHMEKEYLATVTEPDKPGTPLRTEAVFGSWFVLALYDHWQGEVGAAREYWARAASLAQAFLERELPALTSIRARNYAQLARNAALAAALSGQEPLARTFFSYAERFSTGLVAGLEEQPESPGAVLDQMGLYPLYRAYSLIRLGRMSGFHGLIFPDPNSDEAVWGQTDVYGLLETAEHCLDIGRRKGFKGFASETRLIPLLRALVATLQEGGEQEEARQALASYERSIRDMSDFRHIYPVVLDLKAAFPAIFNA